MGPDGGGEGARMDWVAMEWSGVATGRKPVLEEAAPLKKSSGSGSAVSPAWRAGSCCSAGASSGTVSMTAE
jgi:hypothetical protein